MVIKQIGMVHGEKQETETQGKNRSVAFMNYIYVKYFCVYQCIC